jgi:hypothetical protein
MGRRSRKAHGEYRTSTEWGCDGDCSFVSPDHLGRDVEPQTHSRGYASGLWRAIPEVEQSGVLCREPDAMVVHVEGNPLTLTANTDLDDPAMRTDPRAFGAIFCALITSVQRLASPRRGKWNLGAIWHGRARTLGVHPP